MSALSYATAGAALLDTYRPGWFRNIDLFTLDQCSTVNCVLGQTYGEYYKGLEALDVEGGDARIYCGFSSNDDYDNLNEAWTQIINSRLAAETAPHPYTPAQAITLGRQIMENRDVEGLIGLLANVSGGDPDLFRAALAPLAQPLAPWERELLSDQPPF